MASKQGNWQTVKSKTDEKRKRQEDKQQQAVQHDRLGVAVTPDKTVFGAFDRSFADVAGKQKASNETSQILPSCNRQNSLPELASHGTIKHWLACFALQDKHGAYAGAFSSLDDEGGHAAKGVQDTDDTSTGDEQVGTDNLQQQQQTTGNGADATATPKKPKLKKPKVTVGQVADGKPSSKHSNAACE